MQESTTARAQDVQVSRCETLAGGYFLLGITAPEAAAAVKPGQIFMLGLPRHTLSADPLLNRPLSVLDAPGAGADGEILFLIKQVGRGTRLLAGLRPGDGLFAHGPLGGTFPEPPAGGTTVLVGGGVGIAPLYFCLRRFQVNARLVLFYGGRTAADLPLRDLLASTAGPDVRLVTEDGSLGERGLVTEPVARYLKQNAADRIYCCGPNAMMAAVHSIGAAAGRPVWVSMENRMGCGMGVCLGCTIPVRDDRGAAMLRVCADGPVFEAGRIDWELIARSPI
ncbi:MAG TPA: dihydroorotate dehydrogenase electron transfer subunit [Acidobacteriota bacterium]|nr:dihydroorotate dehydrogenase electron transfer subunit [Acidobacteriota bacterium]HNR38298.1 dihydroorotate dehydrogenase electron transfer subunit [Acidobacteriota bacterium]HPB27567.1 dihydroorotate dehydrogenase electron transfer subunit [Acidobacteriota bacterium]